LTANQLVPVAQYLRISCEYQQYSLENQSTVIQEYAETQNFEVVRAEHNAEKSTYIKQ
jgi:DNA invertase Pin-like site-specific DNA recombinase